MHYVGISTYQFIPYYASDAHKHTRVCLLKQFEDNEPSGLKVDIAIIIKEICKAPTLQLGANKHSITHIMYIEMEMLSAIK